MITWYKHHGKKVAVQLELKGKHRAHCLCWQCAKFNPGWRGIFSCLRSKLLYLYCVVFGMVTPVYECPAFFNKGQF